MKTVFILFDSLNRQALSCYNKNARPTPAFDRLAKRGVVFDNHYVGSLPCMPARRDLLTGRLNFLHRSWGPVEPFDVCFPSLLADNNIYTHLISDHYHYWEQGGCGYHNQYSSAEFVRGQERDLWKAMVQPPMDRFREQYHPMLSHVQRRTANMVNREFIVDEADFPIVQCVKLANEFLDHNHSADKWLLQVELFDPHEPFTAPERFRHAIENEYDGPVLDWPIYAQLDLTDSEARELQANYQAVVAMCDYYLGQLLDQFDQYDLWKDTAIVLTTDHGFLLGEHNWWGKNVMPVYDPIAHIPLIMYHPDATASAGEHRTQLTQCLDVSATLIDFHKPTAPSATSFRDGVSLLPAIEHGSEVRRFALYGIFGGALNITDGRYSYFHYPCDESPCDLFEYTLMPAHPVSYFTQEEFNDAELISGLPYADGYPVMKIRALDNARRPPMQGAALAQAQSVLYDLHTDPQQQSPITDQQLHDYMIDGLIMMMKINNAPPELYTRFGLHQ